ncbi:MAG TPA: hypothetical protein VE650_03370, partial [Acetobacteraceae bacterium]|nr:hypothetical protein [Acetobacteraceae bacterium]
MAVAAPPISGFALASLARWAATLPPTPDASGLTGAPSSRQPDLIVFSSATPLRLLSDLASTGLRQLISLLPIVERLLQDPAPEASPLPLGHLAKALGAAAQQIEEGHEGLLTGDAARLSPGTARASSTARDTLRATARELGVAYDPYLPRGAADRLQSGRAPDARQALRAAARQVGEAHSDSSTPQAPAPGGDRAASAVNRWLGDAKQALRGASGLLVRAEYRLQAAASPSSEERAPPTVSHAPAGSDTAWALNQVSLAQHQVAAALLTVTASPLRRVAPSRAPAAAAPATRIYRLNSVIAALGAGLLAVLGWLAAGSWSLASGFACLVVTGMATAVW